MKKGSENVPEKVLGEIKTLQRLNDYEFGFEADILRDGPVQGGRWVFNNIRDYYKTFAGRPVLVAYIGSKVGDGHNSRDRVDPRTGEQYRSFLDPTAERIVGTISEDLSDLTLFEEGNHTWLRVKGRIWTEYAKELVDTIIRTGRMSVSIEANVYDVREEDGREVYDRWEALGLTILGLDVEPAVPGANIRALSDMEEEFENMKLRVASLVKESESRENKPHKNNTKKELKKQMILSKQQLRELQAKFPEGYKVIAASSDEGKIRMMAMRTKDHAFLAYTMDEKDAGVYQEKFEMRTASIRLNEDGEDDALCAEAGEVICDEMAECTAEKDRACAENANLAAELKTVKAELAEMKSFEEKRRKTAAADHAKATLAKYNANRADKVSESVIASVVTAAENGEYNDKLDAEKNWIGLNAVERDVKALCADEQMKLDANTAMASQNDYIWNHLTGNRTDDGSPAALLASL